MRRNMRADFEESATCQRDEEAAAFHELVNALTAVTNYLAAADRLSKRGPPPSLGEVLAKCLGQSERAAEATRRLRRLLRRGRVPDRDSLSCLR